MHRHVVIAAALLALAVPALTSAQSTTDDRERARIEREKAREQARERAQKAREEAERAREFERERRDRERERDRESAGRLDTTVVFDAQGTLVVSCPQGDVIVVGDARNELSVRARTERGALRFTSNGSRASIEPTSGRGGSDGRFEIRVPTGTRVSIRSSTGDISVSGVHGDLETRSQSADVKIRDAGRIDVETMSGDVAIERVTGDAIIRTVSGDIDLTDARGDVEVESVSGDIGLRDVAAKQIRTHTTSGDVTFSGPIMADGRYEYNTHAGEIRLVLPGDVGAQLSVATFSGGIESDFPLTLQAGQEHGNKRLSFTLGKGGARIIAETFSGDITLISTPRRR